MLRSTGCRRAGFSSCGSRALERRLIVVVLQLSCSAACGIFPDQDSNPCPLHWQADSQPLCHQGSPSRQILNHCATREAHTSFLDKLWELFLSDIRIVILTLRANYKYSRFLRCADGTSAFWFVGTHPAFSFIHSPVHSLAFLGPHSATQQEQDGARRFLLPSPPPGKHLPKPVTTATFVRQMSQIEATSGKKVHCGLMGLRPSLKKRQAELPALLRASHGGNN